MITFVAHRIDAIPRPTQKRVFTGKTVIENKTHGRQYK